jgi:hypothetical protein
LRLSGSIAAISAVIAAADTIPISSFEELCRIGVDEGYPLAGDYRLAADIDASGSRGLNDGAGFLPIGGRKVLVPGGFGAPDVIDSTEAFTGTFDGWGHTISGLYIKRTASDAAGSGSNIGLFGFVFGARISNVTVVADTVVGYNGVGALAGRQSGGVIERCVALGAVVGQAAVGGLVGEVEEGGAVRVCYSSVDVAGGEGVIGDIGGLVGASGAVVSESYSVGAVSVVGGARVGGLVGSLTDRARVLSCYSVSAVSGGDAAAVGGLVGKVDDGGEVRRSYSAGVVSGGSGVGGLIGDGGVTAALYSSWDTERSGCAVSAGGAGAAGRTTAQMMSASVMNGLVAADTASWGISNNYPYLKNGFFPKRAITVAATRGGALSGDTAAGGAHTQRVNLWTGGKTVVAMPSSDSIAGGFDGWYLAGSDTALVAGRYDGDGFSVGTASVDGTTGEFSISSLTADSVAIEARFILKKYKLTYIAINGRGRVVSQDDNEGTREVDTLVKLVEHGAVSSVTAEPYVGYRFLQWWADQNNKSIKEPARADTALKDFEYRVSFADSTIELTYNAGSGGRLRVNEAPPPYVSTHTVRPQYGTNGPPVLAVPNNADYRFIMWDDSVAANPRVDSAAVSFVVTAIFEAVPVSVKSPDRVVPSASLTDAAAQIRPVKTISGGLTAAPNPVLRQSGKVDLCWQGPEIIAGTLFVFDANGKFIRKIIISDNSGGISKRPIAAWDLTDANRAPAGTGTYLIRGTLSTKPGKSEKVALILQLI